MFLKKKNKIKVQENLKSTITSHTITGVSKCYDRQKETEEIYDFFPQKFMESALN